MLLHLSHSVSPAFITHQIQLKCAKKVAQCHIPHKTQLDFAGLKVLRLRWLDRNNDTHYCDAIMGANASQITSLTIVFSTMYSDADQRKHQSSASLAFVRGTHRGPVNSPHKGPVALKKFPFGDVIMIVTTIGVDGCGFDNL